MTMLIWMRGLRQKDKIKNEYVRGESGINLLKTITRKIFQNLDLSHETLERKTRISIYIIICIKEGLYRIWCGVNRLGDSVEAVALKQIYGFIFIDGFRSRTFLYYKSKYFKTCTSKYNNILAVQ